MSPTVQTSALPPSKLRKSTVLANPMRITSGPTRLPGRACHMTSPTPIVNRLAASWTNQCPSPLSLSVLVATSARQIAPTRTPAATTPAVTTRPGRLAAPAVRADRGRSRHLAAHRCSPWRIDSADMRAIVPSGSTPGHRAGPWNEPAMKQGQHGRRRPGSAEDSSAQAALSGRNEEIADGHTSRPDPGSVRARHASAPDAWLDPAGTALMVAVSGSVLAASLLIASLSTGAGGEPLSAAAAARARAAADLGGSPSGGGSVSH